MTGLRRALAAAGVGSTALAAAAALAPDLLARLPVLGGAVEATVSLGPTTATLLAGALAGLAAAAVARSGGTPAGGPADEQFDAARETPPEAVTAGHRRQVGATTDRLVERGVAGERAALAELRERLRVAATDAQAARGVEREAAEAAVAAGTWTDDPLAAAVLAGPEGPTPGVVDRLRLWLVSERERQRRVERTVTAIEAATETGDDR